MSNQPEQLLLESSPFSPANHDHVSDAANGSKIEAPSSKLEGISKCKESFDN